MGMSHFIMMSYCIYIYPWDEHFYNPTRDCANTTIHHVSSWLYFWNGKEGSFVPILPSHQSPARQKTLHMYWIC